jgi:hypothetical protein
MNITGEIKQMPNELLKTITTGLTVAGMALGSGEARAQSSFCEPGSTIMPESPNVAVQLYSQPGLVTSGSLYYNEKVEVIDQQNDWIKIQRGGDTFFVLRKFVKDAGNPKDESCAVPSQPKTDPTESGNQTQEATPQSITISEIDNENSLLKNLHGFEKLSFTLSGLKDGESLSILGKDQQGNVVWKLLFMHLGAESIEVYSIVNGQQYYSGGFDLPSGTLDQPTDFSFVPVPSDSKIKTQVAIHVGERLLGLPAMENPSLDATVSVTAQVTSMSKTSDGVSPNVIIKLS